MPLSTPTTGGGGRRATGSARRLTYFQWTEVRIGLIRAVTPTEGEKPKAPITVEEHIRKSLRFDEATRKGDVRPTLVYFHWPHEDRTNGKLTATLCKQVMDDEEAARWSRLFRCVQVDMSETVTEYAERVGAEKKPSYVALNHKLEVVAKIPAIKSATKLRKALVAALDKFPAYRKKVMRDVAAHEKKLAEAKKLEKKGNLEEALELVDEIRFGDLRIGKAFDKIYAYGLKLALKVERQRAKDD